MESGVAAFLITFFVIIGAVLILTIVGMWKIFQKAGYEGWECIVPIYGAIILFRIIGKPWWWLILLCIPLVNYVFLVWMWNMLSKSFGKDEGFTVGLIFLGFIFIPILGFGSAQYQGPYGDPYLFQQYQEEEKSFDFESNKLQ